MFSRGGCVQSSFGQGFARFDSGYHTESSTGKWRVSCRNTVLLRLFPSFDAVGSKTFSAIQLGNFSADRVFSCVDSKQIPGRENAFLSAEIPQFVGGFVGALANHGRVGMHHARSGSSVAPADQDNSSCGRAAFSRPPSPRVGTSSTGELIRWLATKLSQTCRHSYLLCANPFRC